MGGDKTKARQLADYVAQRDPAQGHLMLAQIAEKKNKPKAETEFKSAVRASGGRADYWFELASFYRRSGRLEEMQSAVDKATELSSKYPSALFFSGRLLLNAGSNYPGGVQMLRAYLSSANFGEDGPEFQAHYILGSLLERQGDTTSAAAEFRSALALASSYKPARDALARVSL